jgi:hypothetical protein
VVLVSESFADRCQEDAHDMLFMVDITDAAHPFPVANYQVTEPSGNFCTRGGRFGAHSINWSYQKHFYKKLIVVSYFNAGVRVVDIRDPFHPREAGHYIPAPQGSRGPIQTNNVEIDERGPDMVCTLRSLPGLPQKLSHHDSYQPQFVCARQ